MTELEKLLDLNIRKIPDFPKKGILFYDITSLLVNPVVFKTIIDKMVELYKNKDIDAVIAAESRGFIFASPFAYLLNKPLILARKKGKLPGETLSEEYELEYGTATLEIHKEDILRVKKVLIVDDLIATGGTIKAITKIAEKADCEVKGIFAVIGLPFLKYNELLKDYDVITLINYYSE